MATIFIITALVMVIVTVGVTLEAIMSNRKSADRLLKLSEIILSWQMIAGGLTIGAGSTFYEPIVTVLENLSRS